jgi:hypothetical protein
VGFALKTQLNEEESLTHLGAEGESLPHQVEDGESLKHLVRDRHMLTHLEGDGESLTQLEEDGNVLKNGNMTWHVAESGVTEAQAPDGRKCVYLVAKFNPEI